jgi:hypothetical protein
MAVHRATPARQTTASSARILKRAKRKAFSYVRSVRADGASQTIDGVVIERAD